MNGAVACRRDGARIEVRGIVQGVGFRPFVYRLAPELALAGWVNNDGAGVTIEVEGDAARIDACCPAPARRGAAARARRRHRGAVLRAARGSRLRHPGERRRAGRHEHRPRQRVCDDCLAELFDPADRRYRYAFINCTNCGPRYTITRALPYDRAIDQHGGVRAVPRVPRRIPRARRPPIPRGAQRVSRLRPATRAARCERYARCASAIPSPQRSRDCAAARSSRSRDWADSTSCATRATPARWRGCARASRGRRSRSR